MCWPISRCVRSSTKRRYRTRCSRAVSALTLRLTTSRHSTSPSVGSSPPIDSPSVHGSPAAPAGGAPPAAGGAGGVLERRRPRRHGELEAGEHALEAEVGVVGELLRRRRAAVARGELLDRARQREHALLVAAGYLHRPRVVAVVALELADDRRDRVRGELAAALRVEALDGAQQADARDLDEVVERLRAAAVAAGEAAGERHEALDELVAGAEVAEARVPAEQALDARIAGLGGAGQRVPARRRRDSGLSGDGDRPPGDERGTADCSPAGLGPVRGTLPGAAAGHSPAFRGRRTRAGRRRRRSAAAAPPAPRSGSGRMPRGRRPRGAP